MMEVGSKKNVSDLEGVTVPVCDAGDCSGERTAGIMEAGRTEKVAQPGNGVLK